MQSHTVLDFLGDLLILDFFPGLAAVPVIKRFLTESKTFKGKEHSYTFDRNGQNPNR